MYAYVYVILRTLVADAGPIVYSFITIILL